jgi:hypothetical protein
LNGDPSPPALNIPFIPDAACGGPSDVSPIWNPEFFGDTMVVNGGTWPLLTVERRRYRFRFLNGCNSRFLLLQFDNHLPFWQIGAEGGLPFSGRPDTIVWAVSGMCVADYTSVLASSAAPRQRTSRRRGAGDGMSRMLARG